jgi:hypothetical protein
MWSIAVITADEDISISAVPGSGSKLTTAITVGLASEATYSS